MKIKNTFTFLLFMLLFSFVTSQNENNRGYKIKVGDQIPEIKLQMRNGEVWTNKNFQDKVVVIQFTRILV